MIATSFPRRGSAPGRQREKGRSTAWSHSLRARSSAQARFAAGSCGYVLTLAGSDTLTDCPGCGGRDFVRASLFSTERIATGRRRPPRDGALFEPAPADREAQLAKARASDRAARRVPLLRGGRRAAHGGAHARVDAHRAQPRRRRALRRPDRLAPARADRAPARRRARARRPQPQRRVRERRARRGQGAAGRRRDHRRALPADLRERRRRGRRAPRAGRRADSAPLG